jgi:phosphoglycerate dehydrogenase-like enzyme
VISPHTAGLSVRENERVVALFSENLKHYLNGDDLVGLVSTTGTRCRGEMELR